MRFRNVSWIFVLFFCTSIAFAAPQITSTTPSSGPAGTQVQFNGSGFGASQGTSTVSFNGVNAAVVSWSDTQIAVTVPSTAITGWVRVTVGGVASNTNIYFVIPAPHINSVSPTSGVGGAQVTINGSGFQATKGSSGITFNGFNATVVSWSDTQIVATIPTNTKTGPFLVSVNGIASNPDVVFTLPNPIVAAVVPSSAPVGTQVQINGSGFGTSQGTSTIKLNNTALTVNSWSDLQILATIPSTAITGTIQVTVGGITSNSNIYFIVPSPQVTAVSPAVGVVGTQVTISGSGFQSTQGSSSIQFNGITAAVNSWSDTQIVATVPASAKTGPAVVTVNSTASNKDVVFTLPNPLITGVVPATAPVGTQVQINGSGFGSTQGSSSVTFYPSGTPTIVSWSDNQIVATVPATATTGGLKIVESGITSNQNIVFSVPAPNITSISPSSGGVNTQVTVNGSGFQATKGSSGITFNGFNATVVSWSDTQIVASASATTSGPVQVTVNSVASNQDILYTTPSPVVTTIAPTTGPAGTQVQVNGSGFGATQGSSTVSFNGTNASVVSWSDTQIVATVPTSAFSGAVFVTVGGVASNMTVNFAIRSVNVFSVTPKVGPIGTQVTISGAGFGATQGSSTLDFNGTTATTISSWSDTQIVASIPVGTTSGYVHVIKSGASSNTDVNFAVGTVLVNSVSPTSVLTGSQFQVNGSGFGATQGSSNLVFRNGNFPATIVSWSDTQITAIAPTVSGSGPIIVTVSSVQSNTDVNLNILGPSISNFSPTSGPVGTQVTINGSNFGATQGTSTVTFNSSSASIVSWSNTQIVATVPSAATSGQVKVRVVNLNSNINQYFTIPAPHISGISPSSGAIGSQLTISGSGFQATQGGGRVYLGTNVWTPVSWSDTQVIVTVPAGAATGPVQVFTNNFQSSNQDFVFALPNPVITGLVPSSGPVGTQVLIKGSGFGATQGTGTVTISTTALTVSSWSDNQIVATVPASTISGQVSVAQSGVTSNTNINFTVPPPHIASVSPSSGVVGGQVTINGSGFQASQSNSTVSINNLNATVTSWSDTQIVAMIPANVATGPVAVNVNRGIYSNQDVILTLPNPQVATLTPTNGPVGTQVQINGTGFGASQGTSTITFNNAAATVSSWSDTQIVATVPPTGATGPVKVAEGGITSNANIFYTVPAPQIASISPNIGGSGNFVTINGSGFQASQGTGIVTFSNGAASAAISSWSDTQIVARVPSGSITDPVKVYATNNQVSDPANYTVPNLSVNALSPYTGAVGTQVTVTGVGYGASQGTSVLTFNGQAAASIVSWSDTQIVATVPVTATSGPVKVAVNNINSNNDLVFTVPAPWVGSYTPGGGTVGTQVTITGSGFQASQRNSTLTFNGVAATPTSWSDTQIIATVPAGATTGPMLVTVNGVSSFAKAFGVPNMTITGVTPPEAPVGGIITINGTGFGNTNWYSPDGNSTVYTGFVNLNGSSMYISSWSDTAITVQVPAYAVSGTLSVLQYNASTNGSLTVEGAPTVTTLAPSTAPVNSSIVISGSGFGPAQYNSTVQFNGNNATVTSWSDSQITAVVPPGTESGPVGVIVATVDGPTQTFTISTSAQVTDSLGHSSNYTSVMIGGSWLGSDSQGSGCSSCTVRGTVHNDYDPLGNLLATKDELLRETDFTYDANGNVASQTAHLDANTPVATSYTYNSFGEPLTVTDPLGNVTTNTYDANGNLLTVTTPKPDAPTAASVTQFAYDVKGQLTQITDPLNHITTLAYYPTGLIHTITDAQSNVTTYEYDLRGNRTAVVDAMQNRTTFAYDLGNRLTGITYPDTTLVSFAYDGRGRRTSVTDQNGKVTSYAYDDADRLTSVTDAAQNVTTYAYDLENNLLSITDAAQHTTSFVYDAFGRVTQTAFPSSLTENYVYDAVGNLTSKTDRKNQTIQYVYDALNRLMHKGYPDATGVDYVYDLVGKIKQVSDPTGSYGFAYDNMGRLIGTTTQYSFLPGTPAPTFSNSYGYDAASNRTSFTAPDGSTNTYAYDTLNRLSTLTNSLTGQFGFSYDVLSRRTTLNRPNGVNTSYGYDSLSRLLSMLHQAGTVTLDGAGYTYDNAGYRTARTNYLNNITEQYTYDPLYQLTQVTQGATTTESYSYDAVGNRISSLGMSPYAYNSTNELISTPSVTFTYDGNGNTITKADSSGTTTYNWDFENKLTSVVVPGSGGTVTFKYDPFGRRIQKSSSNGTTNYLYEAANSIEELDSAGLVLARYTQGSIIDEPLAESRSGAVIRYYEQDGLGAVTSLSDSTGTVANSYTYDTFGNLTASTGSFMNPFQYTGRDYDTETGLQYYRARYYDSRSGRFLSEDPIRLQGGINFYAYVKNSPVRYLDPTGLERADWQEKKNDVEKVGWLNALKGNGFAQEALEAAQEWARDHGFGVNSLHNGAADAWRHCFWSCTMAKYIGEYVAEIIADEHEKSGNRHGQPPDEELMDRGNNLAGRTCANRKDKNCWDACTELYYQGRLRTLGGGPLLP
jgi:RHS repeat-associated protein